MAHCRFRGTVSRELIKVGIAINQLKALFKGYFRPSQNFNFIKGTLHNQQKKIQLMKGLTILDVTITIAWHIFYQGTS